jgi:hypothetical protein
VWRWGVRKVVYIGRAFTRRNATDLEFAVNFERDYVRRLPSGAVVRVCYAPRDYATGRKTRYHWRAFYYSRGCDLPDAFQATATRSAGLALLALRTGMRERAAEV